MPISVNVPDVGIVNFPDSMSQDDIRGVLTKRFGKEARYEDTQRALKGPLEPVASEGERVTGVTPMAGKVPESFQVSQPGEEAPTEAGNLNQQYLSEIEKYRSMGLELQGRTDPDAVRRRDMAFTTAAGLEQARRRALKERGVTPMESVPEVFQKQIEAAKLSDKEAEGLGIPKWLAAAERGAVNVIGGFGHPENIQFAGMGVLPGTAQGIVGGALLGTVAKGGVESIASGAGALSADDIQKGIEDITTGTGTLGALAAPLVLRPSAETQAYRQLLKQVKETPLASVEPSPIRRLGVRLPADIATGDVTAQPEIGQLIDRALAERRPGFIAAPGERPAIDVLSQVARTPEVAEAEAIPSARQAALEQPAEQRGLISGSSAEKWADNLLEGGAVHAGPDVLAAYAVKGAAILERGFTDFGRWATEMIKQHGPQIADKLRDIYERAKGMLSNPQTVKDIGELYATEAGKEPKGFGEHPGVSPRGDVRADEAQIRQGESGQAGGGGGAEQRPPTPEVSGTRASDARTARDATANAISRDYGIRFDGEGHGRWWWSAFDEKGGVSTSFMTKAGIPVADVLKRYNEVRQSYADSPFPKPRELLKPGATADDLIKQPQGSMTVDDIQRMSDDQVIKLFENRDAEGNLTHAPHPDGVAAGLKLTAADEPRVQKIIDDARAKQDEAIKSGDGKAFQSIMARETWAQGVLEGIRREGPNFDAYVNVEGVQALDPQSGMPLSATDSLINKLESLKLAPDDAGRLYSLPHPDVFKSYGKAIWNTGIDAAILAIKAGRKLGQAIDEAWTKMQAFAKERGMAIEESKVRGNLAEILKSETGIKEQKQPTEQQALKTSEQIGPRPTVGELINPALRQKVSLRGNDIGKTETQSQLEKVTGAATATFGNVVSGWLGTVAGKTLPKITLRDRQLGELGARFAASRAAAMPAADLFVTDVLTGLNVDPAKFDAALKADNLLSVRENFLARGDQENAANVNDLLGSDKFPFKNERELADYFRQPDVQEALNRHRENWNKTIEPMYKEAAGIDPNVELPTRGKYSGARVNLNPLIPEEYEPANGQVVSGKSHPGGTLTGTMRRKTPFAREAYGTGQRYVLNYAETMANTFAKQMEIANKRAFDDYLVKTGNAVIAEPGRSVITPDGEATKSFPFIRRGFENRNIYIRRSLAEEYAHASDVVLNPYRTGIVAGFNRVTAQLALAGLTDATVHIENLGTAVFQVPGTTGLPLFAEAFLSAMARADVPVVIGRGALKSLPEFARSPLFQKFASKYIPESIVTAVNRAVLKNMSQMVSIAEVNAARMPHQRGMVGMRLLGNAVQGADRTTRMLLDDAFKNLQKQGLVDPSETARREFINQAGNYNLRTQGKYMRFLRQTWISPFITAGRNFATLGIRAMMLDPGVKASNLPTFGHPKATTALPPS